MKHLTGTVIHTKLAKTAKILVVRRWSHPLYQKTLTKKKHYLVDCQIKLKVGDKVIIKSVKPVSKKKRWQVVKKI